MQKNLFTFLICFVNMLVLWAGEGKTGAHVTGNVKSDNEKVSFVNVIIKGTTIGTTTDQQGNFKLMDLPVGTHTVMVRGIGYKSAEAAINITNNETKKINFELEKDILNLEKVVVSANKSEINRTESPVVVNSLPPKLFETVQAVTVAEGLDFTPGLRTECNCQNCGFMQVRMNGLDGPYSQILINSRPIFSGLAGVYGLELMPAAMVDRVEIVRGGGSALFGGNAIAGSINIITKEPSFNSFSVESKMGVTGFQNHADTDPSIDRSVNVNGSVVTDDMKSGISVYGLIRNRDPFDENGDGFSELVLLENTTLGLSAYHKLTSQSKLSLDLYRINEFRRGGNNFELLPHEADITEQVDHGVTGGGINYDLFTHPGKYNKLSVYAALQQVNRASYYGAEQDPNAYGATNDLTASMGSQYTYHFDRLLFSPATVIAGIDNNFHTLEDNKLGANGEENTLITDQYVNTIGSYVQSDWKTDFVKVALGIRYDNYLIRDNKGLEDDIQNGVWAPRANVLFNILPTLQYRISYAKGYRAPQIFDEDLHIEASAARRVLHSNSSDLKQETSHSMTTSINTNFAMGTVMNELLVEGFYTRLIDPFVTEYNAIDDEGTFEHVRYNGDGAHVAGVNIEYNTVLTSDIELQLGLTIQESRYDSPYAWGDIETNVTKEFVRTPNRYGYSMLHWHVTKAFELSISGTYTGAMYVPHLGLDPDTDVPEERAAIENGDVIAGERLEKSEEFYHVGLKAAYDFKISPETTLQVNVGIQNIFNQTQKEHDSGIYRDAGYIYGPCKPRALIIGLKLGNFLN
ncbi:MAG: TonB-dependent receptor [Bacteroidetes bacterium]|nr:TonB-dependent receptor [Bacteroidota bacterium]